MPARGGTLSIHYAYGLTDEERSRGVYAHGEGVTGKVFKTGQVALIQEIDNESIYLTRVIRREVLPGEIEAYIRMISLINSVSSAAELRPAVAAYTPPGVPQAVLPGSLRPYAWVNEEEREVIISSLKNCGGNKTRAAISMGLTPRQLRYRMGKLNI